METLLAFLIFIGILILVHEFGHFIVAKAFGVKVEVFSIGFGPPLIRKKWGETVYQIALLPLGGYVKMYGEEDTPEAR
ncbi:MAG TPA: RIP metalloprotease, partial [Aquificales bacterium]|nr:RIP metalloprotease [Aquificales bacterium]